MAVILLTVGCADKGGVPQQGTKPGLQTEETEMQITTQEVTTISAENNTKSIDVSEEETIDRYQHNFNPYENLRSVLLGESCFCYTGNPYYDDGVEYSTNITLSEFLEIADAVDVDKSEWKFTCVDLDGDNIKECVVDTNMVHYQVLVFHYEMGNVAMFVYGVKSVSKIYNNGIIAGWTGPQIYYCKMYFSERKSLLANVAGSNMVGVATEEIVAWIPVDGVRTEVTGAEYEHWREEQEAEFLGEAAPKYDFTPENIKDYVTE